MWFRYPIIILLFWLLAIIQMSITPFLNIGGVFANLIFILFYILVFFEDIGQYRYGFFDTVTAGFFLDVILPFSFGVSVISLLIIYGLNKLATHFLGRSFSKYFIVYFIVMFSFFFFLYNGLLFIASQFWDTPINFSWSILGSLLYNIFFACLGFYVYSKIFRSPKGEDQLKLL